MSQPVDPYAVLAIARTADAATVRAAFRLGALLHHPDRPGGSTVRMQAITNAYGILGDVASRAAWDLAASRSPKSPPARQDPLSAPGRAPSSPKPRRTGWPHASEERHQPAAAAASSTRPTIDKASRLAQWAAIAVVLSGLQQLTMGGGGVLMAVASTTLALRVFAACWTSGEPFWPSSDAGRILRRVAEATVAWLHPPKVSV